MEPDFERRDLALLQKEQYSAPKTTILAKLLTLIKKYNEMGKGEFLFSNVLCIVSVVYDEILKRKFSLYVSIHIYLQYNSCTILAHMLLIKNTQKVKL